MDADRFDTLAKTLTSGLTRRAVLRLPAGSVLAAGMERLGLGSAVAAKKCKKRCGPCKRCKKGKCKPKPDGTACAGGTCQRGACLSPGEAYGRCLEPAIAAFEAEFARCEPQCDDVGSAACRSCREPGVGAVVAAADACARDACRCEVGDVSAERNRTPRAERAVRGEGSGCNRAELSKCVKRANEDLGPCLLGAGGVREVFACSLQSKNSFTRCVEDFGCKSGYCVAGDFCCPRPLDTPCDGGCCDATRCETCVGGACVGCKRPAVCERTPSGDRVCRCPANLEQCGKGCCTRGQECCGGRCRPACRPDHERDPDTCECYCTAGPPRLACEGDEVCCDGDCCPAAECCPDGCCRDGKICCRGLECCPLERCCGDGCCGAEEECCGVPGHCLPACPTGQARDPQTCQCVSQCPVPESTPSSLRRPPDRSAVRGEGISPCTGGHPPCLWPETEQQCCEFGYVCTANKVCCLPEHQPCGGSPKAWGCCCDTAAGEVCNPDFDDTPGSECCPCKDGGIRCADGCCKPGETCDPVNLRCAPCPVA